jgi:hypothetical protein
MVSALKPSALSAVSEAEIRQRLLQRTAQDWGLAWPAPAGRSHRPVRPRTHRPLESSPRVASAANDANELGMRIA